jgi:GT2 family glycosyltransferase
MILTRLLKGVFGKRPVDVSAGTPASPPRNAVTPLTKIRCVIATRSDKQTFYAQTAAGRSLALHNYPFVEHRIFCNNRTGLPKIYNMAIEEARGDPAILIFMHDDVHLIDFHWAARIRAALLEFDLVGLAGNVRRLPRQPGWMFVDTEWTVDASSNLSGAVGHGKSFPGAGLSLYGETPQEVKILDGLMMAIHSKSLIDGAIRFDERFDFHFYDLDFCRQAEQRGLRMGTWPIAVIHESDGAGGFGAPAWCSGRDTYFKKWGD